VSYPTDLTAEEQELAQARLRELAARFVADGVLRSPMWREVFQRTWRHPYVPSFYPALDAPCLLCIDPQRRAEWLGAVYRDQTLITKVVQVPLSRALRPGSYPVYTSSSTLPSLVLRMLEALDVHDGQRVLEIGTGTGYHAALLCERLGSECVTSIDIDPELVELAGERLAANGYTPTLAAVDGAGGYPPGAPYERIIATCAVRAIPPAWLDQAAPGAVILADVHGPLGGTLARLTVDAADTATGRFLPDWAGFMWLRHTPGLAPPEPRLWSDDEPVDSVSAVDPALLSDGLFGFVAQWHLPDVTWGPTPDNGAAAIHLWAPDGSRAVARTTTVAGGGFPVSQAGPRRLWNRVEEAYRFWEDTGRPHYDQFGITATPTEQYVWYAHPGSPHRWPLLNP
jgi:methyltransferase of ATP-grasp peptide maturase system